MKAIISPTTRQPIIPGKLGGLNATGNPKAAVPTIVNNSARKK